MKIEQGKLLEAALSYADRGWRVLPLKIGDKKPATSHGVKDAAADRATIERRWASTPFNVGIALGKQSGICAIDIDNGHSPGQCGETEWARLASGREAKTPTSATGGGGNHILFQYSDRLKNGAEFAAGVNLRSDGYYIVAPPSVHPNGNPYQWLIDPIDTPLAPFPDWLMPIVKGNLASHVDATATPIGEYQPKPRLGAADRCAAYHDSMDRAIDGGGGNKVTYRAGLACWRFGLTDVESWNQLVRFNSTKCDGPWLEHDLRRIWKSSRAAVDSDGTFGSFYDKGATAYEPEHFEGLSSGTSSSGATVSTESCGPGETQETAKPGKNIELLEMHELEFADVDWLWSNRIAKGCITMLAGEASGGKGLITFDIAARVSRGLVWPDGSIAPEAGQVILFSGEDDPQRVIGPRLKAAEADLTNIKTAKGTKTITASGKQYIDAFTMADADLLDKLLSEYSQCKLVVIDPLGDFLGGETDGDKDNKVRAVLQPIAALAEKHGVAVLIVAHYRKCESSKADDKIMGSRAFTALARNVWHVAQDEETKIRYLLSGKSNLALPAPGMSFITEAVSIEGLKSPVPKLKWGTEPVLQTADEWGADQRGQSRRGPRPDRLQEAKEFLEKLLEDRIKVSAAEATKLAEDQKISHSTLKRAREDLNVETWREGDGRHAAWHWGSNQRGMDRAMVEAADKKHEDAERERMQLVLSQNEWVK